MDQAPKERDKTSDLRRSRHLAMLSHDLKSALTGVIGGLKQIETEKLNQTDLRHRDGALAAALEATRLLDGILDIEAIESGEFQLNVEVTNLEGFLAELYRRWTARAEWKNLILKIFMDGDLPKSVELDRGRLSRVLGNLLDNAIKYTEQGKVELAVALKAPDTLSFTVTDDGPGFSEEALDSLFEFRGRPANSTKPGSGLGLYISQSLLSQMNGEVRISNRPGRGARARVEVPTKVGAMSAAPAEKTASVAVIPSMTLPDLTGLTILLAEDNITNQMVVTQMLDAMGAQFEIASDGIEALEKFEKREYDLLLLDIEMPRLSGLDVIRRIRARGDARQSTPIIALTAYAMREHREKISEAGADGLIPKPILGIEDFGTEILGIQQRSAPASAPPQDAGTAAPLTRPTIDSDAYEHLEKTLGHATMRELLGKVLTDLETVAGGIKRGLSLEDRDALGSASHTLISVSGAIGATASQEAAQTLNTACHRGSWEDVTKAASVSLTRIDELRNFVSGKIRL